MEESRAMVIKQLTVMKLEAAQAEHTDTSHLFGRVNLYINFVMVVFKHLQHLCYEETVSQTRVN